jgi:hypothetical protein
MPEYRRAYVPGGSFFLTLVTYHRTPLFPIQKISLTYAVRSPKLGRKDLLKLLELSSYLTIFIFSGLYHPMIPIIPNESLGKDLFTRVPNRQKVITSKTF